MVVVNINDLNINDVNEKQKCLCLSETYLAENKKDCLYRNGLDFSHHTICTVDCTVFCNDSSTVTTYYPYYPHSGAYS